MPGLGLLLTPPTDFEPMPLPKSSGLKAPGPGATDLLYILPTPVSKRPLLEAKADDALLPAEPSGCSGEVPLGDFAGAANALGVRGHCAIGSFTEEGPNFWGVAVEEASSLASGAGLGLGAELARGLALVTAGFALPGEFARTGVLALSTSYAFWFIEFGPEKRSFAALRAHTSTTGFFTAPISWMTPPPILGVSWMVAPAFRGARVREVVSVLVGPGRSDLPTVGILLYCTDGAG